MLCWNVYVGDFNSGEIKLFNVFNHYGFYQDCLKAKKKYKDDKDGFAEEVRHSLMYCFWSKCEWEIILQHWPSGEYYSMRREALAGKLCEAMASIGNSYDESDLWAVKPDSMVTIHVFPKRNRYHDKKIDVYEQVMNNWDIFIDYLWNNRNELKARKQDDRGSNA